VTFGLLGADSAGAAETDDESGMCQFCKGTGFLNCIRCKGTGQALKIGWADKYEDCPECQATGMAICARCDTTGLSKTRFKSLKKDRRLLKLVNQNLYNTPKLTPENRAEMRSRMDAAIAAAEVKLGATA